MVVDFDYGDDVVGLILCVWCYGDVLVVCEIGFYVVIWYLYWKGVVGSICFECKLYGYRYGSGRMRKRGLKVEYEKGVCLLKGMWM